MVSTPKMNFMFALIVISSEKLESSYHSSNHGAGRKNSPCYFPCPEHQLCWTEFCLLNQDVVTGYHWSYFIKADNLLLEIIYD
jgi:hypothetical protein